MLWAQKQGLIKGSWWLIIPWWHDKAAAFPWETWTGRSSVGTLGCGVNSKKFGNAETSFQTSSVGVPRRSITCATIRWAKWVIPWHEKRRKTSEQKRLLNNGTTWYIYIYNIYYHTYKYKLRIKLWVSCFQKFKRILPLELNLNHLSWNHWLLCPLKKASALQTLAKSGRNC